MNGSTIFAATSAGGVYLSTNSGANWTAVGLPNNVNCLAASGGNIFAGINGGLYLSTDNGATWTSINTALSSQSVTSLAVSGGTIFAWTSAGSIYRSTDGTSWTAVNTGFSTRNVTCLAISGSNIFAGTNGGGVYLSTNNYASWIPVGFANLSVTSLSLSGSSVFAGTNAAGVYLSNNNGASWASVNTGLPLNVPVTCLAMNSSTIFAVTSGGDKAGVWRRPLSEVMGVIQSDLKKPFVSGFRINVNKTNISVLLPPSNGPVTVRLFNVAGRKIYSATHKAHDGMLNIPVSGLSTGRYLMSVTGNNIRLSSSIVLTR
jgi:photosystem II stability/assembly factor-like uncharacterized protein